MITYDLISRYEVAQNQISRGDVSRVVVKEVQRVFFNGANARLSAVTMGEKGKPVVVAVHGLRDHALGMYELLAPLADDFYVISLDLRGHGHSDKVATYTMIQFMADLKTLFDHFEIPNARLVGHSLGGHIVSRFAATYPGKVEQLVLLDGMGPPGIQEGFVPSQTQMRLRQGVETVIAITGNRRAIPSIEEASARLKRNNPLISDDLLKLVVVEGTEPHPDGGVRWRWESAVNMIWDTFSSAETEALVALIPCPVLIVTGDRGLDYWVAMREELDNKDFYEEELVRREQLFQNGRHIVIDNAGHMLHYDQAAAVYAAVDEFFGAKQQSVA